MSDPEEEMKYRVKNEQSVQGQVIGDHATVHQYFHSPVASTDLSVGPSNDVIILTALPGEFRAVVAHLQGTQEVVHPETGTIYHQGSFPGKQGIWHVAVAQIGMGGLSAASETERASNLFHPRLMLFVGIAGGLKDVRHGDVVVATKVYAYESGKAAARFNPRPEVWHASHALEQRARTEANNDEWLARLSDQRPDPTPRILFGSLAAGEKVLSDQRSSLYRFLQTTYGDSLAVEMEGHGFLQAVHANQHIYALVIRGISDLIDDKFAADAADMQEKAARHAAAFAFQVLAKLTLPPGNISVLEQKPFPEGPFLPEHTAHQESIDSIVIEGLSQAENKRRPEKRQHIVRKYLFKNGNLRFRGPIVFVVVLLVLSLASFTSIPAYFTSFFRPSQQAINTHSTLDSRKVSDSHLSVSLLRVDSPSFVFWGAPEHYSGGGDLPVDTGAVLLSKNTTSYFTIVLSVVNLEHVGDDILIDYVTLKLLQIPSIPRPLTVWTHGVATTDTSHPYPATYTGQNPGQSLNSTQLQNVSLAHDEPDQVDIQVHSTVSVYLRFQVQVTYQITGTPQTLMLLQTFQVIFSDATNWQEYILQNGSLVRKI